MFLHRCFIFIKQFLGCGSRKGKAKRSLSKSVGLVPPLSWLVQLVNCLKVFFWPGVRYLACPPHLITELISESCFPSASAPSVFGFLVSCAAFPQQGSVSAEQAKLPTSFYPSLRNFTLSSFESRVLKILVFILFSLDFDQKNYLSCIILLFGVNWFFF